MPSVIRLPTFDWEKIIADPNTRHALQDFATQINVKLEDLQEQIDDIADTDTGVPPHNVLQSDVHLDSETDDPSPGSLIVGAPGGESDLSEFWQDGLPIGYGYTEVSPNGCQFWQDGLPFLGLGSLVSGDVKWVELLIGPAGYVLTSRGSRVEWAEASTLVNRVSVSAYLNADISFGRDVLTTLTPLAVEFDSGFWSSAEPSKLTVPPGESGTYLAVARTNWLPPALGQLTAVVLKNGTAIDDADPDFGISLTASARVLELAEGDEVELAAHWYYVDEGTRTVRSGIDRTFLQLVRVN